MLALGDDQPFAVVGTLRLPFPLQEAALLCRIARTRHIAVGGDRIADQRPERVRLPFEIGENMPSLGRCRTTRASSWFFDPHLAVIDERPLRMCEREWAGGSGARAGSVPGA